MKIDLEIFNKKYNKEEKIKIIQTLGFKLNDFDIEKINREDILLKAYKCSMGVNTIGIGATFYENGKKVQEGDVISLVEAIELYEYHLSIVGLNLHALFSVEEIKAMGQVRVNVVLDLLFNMGINKVKKFPSMIKALKNKEWKRASLELKYANVEKGILSNYYQQVGQRAVDNVERLEKGI